MQEIKQISGTGIPLLLDDIDTDRIIPARYLRCVTFDGLGEHAFEDDRKQDSSHPFDNKKYSGASVLVSGRNFGCGSSREHAPQSLIRWGIGAVVAESFAEIFFGNCTGLGVPCIRATTEQLQQLAAAIEADPQMKVTVDVENCTVSYGEQSFTGTIPEGTQSALVTGQWDFLAELLAGEEKIRTTAGTLPYLTNFA